MKVTLTINLSEDKSIALTLEEANELYDKLNDIFGRVQYYPSIPPMTPYITPSPLEWAQSDRILCEANSEKS